MDYKFENLELSTKIAVNIQESTPYDKEDRDNVTETVWSDAILLMMMQALNFECGWGGLDRFDEPMIKEFRNELNRTFEKLGLIKATYQFDDLDIYDKISYINDQLEKESPNYDPDEREFGICVEGVNYIDEDDIDDEEDLKVYIDKYKPGFDPIAYNCDVPEEYEIPIYDMCSKKDRYKYLTKRNKKKRGIPCE